jgi:DNA-binding LacI/PurR family transcriptional regulator
MAQLDRTSPVPLYHQIERSLLILIRQRNLAAGGLFPSENELALEFGVTRLTIRRAIDRLAQQGVLYRERGRGTFVTDPTAAMLQSTVGTLTIAMPSMTSVIHLQTLAGVEQEARMQGYQLVVTHSDGDARLEAQQIASVEATGAAGLLLWPLGGATDRAALARLRAANVPCVLLDRYLEDVDADYVVVDDFTGAYQATTHLAGFGHRRIALVLYEDVDVSAVRLRRDGYRQALVDHGLAFDDALVVRHPILPDPTHLDLMTAIAQQLRHQPDPATAVFCVNDHLAQALLITLQRQAVEVPQQFSIVGFDGLEYMPTHQRLTTIRRATNEMGRAAVRLLLDRLNGRIDGSPQHIVLPTELVAGETTAPAP